jgi:hypothetical protein
VAVHVDLLPERTRADLVARLWFGGRRDASIDELTLATAVVRRHTNRRPFLDRPIPTSVRDALTKAALKEGGRLILLEDPARYGAVASLLKRAEIIQREDPATQAEKRHWIAERPGQEDGVPPIAGGPPPFDEPLVLLRDYGPNAPRMPRTYEQEPPLAVLVTHGDTPLDHLHAGQAMQHVLLCATAAGVSASFLSAAVELPACRKNLRALLDASGHGGQPQLILRLGYGPPAPTTARRHAEAVTRRQGSQGSQYDRAMPQPGGRPR